MPKIRNLKILLPYEEEEQRAFFRWVNFMVREIPELATIHAIPNQGAGPSRGMAGRMKAMGARAGVPDVFWPLARGGYNGLYIEFKRQKGGRLSPAQNDFMGRVRLDGYMAVVARGSEEAKEIVLRYARAAL